MSDPKTIRCLMYEGIPCVLLPEWHDLNLDQREVARTNTLTVSHTEAITEDALREHLTHFEVVFGKPPEVVLLTGYLYNAMLQWHRGVSIFTNPVQEGSLDISRWLKKPKPYRHECGCETEGPFTACGCSMDRGVFTSEVRRFTNAEWLSYDDLGRVTIPTGGDEEVTPFSVSWTEEALAGGVKVDNVKYVDFDPTDPPGPPAPVESGVALEALERAARRPLEHQWPTYDDVIKWVNFTLGPREGGLRQAQAHLNTTGCKNCDDNGGDPKWRCLLHRRRNNHDRAGVFAAGDGLRRGMDEMDFPDPNDTIEGRHRRAARRWAKLMGGGEPRKTTGGGR